MYIDPENMTAREKGLWARLDEICAKIDQEGVPRGAGMKYYGDVNSEARAIMQELGIWNTSDYPYEY